MRIIGWDLADWRDGEKNFTSGAMSEDTARSLAGNAFSGYAFAPVCAAALACMRLPCMPDGEEGPEEEPTGGGEQEATSSDSD